MTNLEAISAREASIFACVCDTVVAPEPVLPPVRETDATFFFDRWMARSPRSNRLALRALLRVIDLAPLALGFRRRLRALPEAERAACLRAAERARLPQLRQLTKLVKTMALLAYYGDDQVMLRIGYDAEAVARHGRQLRAAEARP